jgi:hypothetical protein
MTALGPKQASTACRAFALRGVAGSDRNVTTFVMALLCFKGSTPGAYGLKASNAALLTSTSGGYPPRPIDQRGLQLIEDITQGETHDPRT